MTAGLAILLTLKINLAMKVKSLKFFLPVFLILILLFACIHEHIDIPPTTKLDASTTSVAADTRVSPASTKWMKRKADRFKQVLEILQLNPEALLDQAADCLDRESLAKQFNIDLSELTAFTEMATLLRLDMTLSNAVLIHNTFEQLLKDSPSKGQCVFQHYGSGNAQIINTEILSHIMPDTLLCLLFEYMDNHCKDCIDIEQPTPSEVNKWITIAKSIEPMISYPCHCPSHHCISSAAGLERFNSSPSTNAPVTTVSPASTKWIKKKADRFNAILLSLELQSAVDLLNIADNYQERLQLAHSYHIDYSELTKMVELADLMRTGMTLSDASLFQSTISSLIENDQLSNKLPNLHQSIHDSKGVLNAVLFRQIQPKILLQEANLFITSACEDCENYSIPSYSSIKDWIEKAQHLEPKITYCN